VRAGVRSGAGDPRAHVDYLDAESLDLIALVTRERSNAHLYEAVGESLLHDPREGTGVRIPIAIEFVVEIRMRIDVENGEAPVLGSNAAQDRIRDRVIAAEGDRTSTGGEDLSCRALDRVPLIASRKVDVASIIQPSQNTKV